MVARRLRSRSEQESKNYRSLVLDTAAFQHRNFDTSGGVKAKVPAARGPAQAKAGKLLSLESRECESLRVAKALFG